RKEFEDWRQKELDQVQAQHRDEIAKVEKKLERIVQEMSARATRELESAGEESKKKFQKKLANVKAQAAREVAQEREKIEPSPTLPTPAAAPQPVALEEGQLVRVTSLAVTGKVMQVKGGDAEVLVGNIKLRRPVSDLEVIAPA